MVENGEFVEPDVYITLPGGDLTDEDSGDEDGGGMLDNVSSHQLQAEAEVHVKTRQGESFRIGSSVEDSEELEDNKNEPTVDFSFIQATVAVEADSTIAVSVSSQTETSNCSDFDENSCSSSYSDSNSASESGDDSVLSVSHSISSRTRGKKHDLSCSSEHGAHSTTSRDSRIGSTSLELHVKV